MIIDTHSHINFQAFDKDRQKVIKRAADNQAAMIAVGSNYENSRDAVEIANKNKNVFAAVGLHPVHLIEQVFEEEGRRVFGQAQKFDFAAFEELALNVDCKAIGETGLDYYHLSDKIPAADQIKIQKQVFLEHLSLAASQDLPLIVHCRGSKKEPERAYFDLLELLRQAKKKPKGVIHCFSADWRIAGEFLKMDFYLGFTGVITFSESLDLLEVVERTPEKRILAETDCPWITPVPFRGKRNEPGYVEYVIEKIADIRDISYDKAAKITTKNAKRLFDIAISSV